MAKILKEAGTMHIPFIPRVINGVLIQVVRKNLPITYHVCSTLRQAKVVADTVYPANSADEITIMEYHESQIISSYYRMLCGKYEEVRHD